MRLEELSTFHGFAEVAYDANTAQYKIETINLVLAALTAHPDSEGRVLILDELGNDLGRSHRERIVRALADAAESSRLTVMGTVQDDLQPIAFRHCGEVLVLHYPSKDDFVNAPTKILATDPTGGGLVGPLADALTEGDDRSVAWRALWDVYRPDTDPTLDGTNGTDGAGGAEGADGRSAS